MDYRSKLWMILFRDFHHVDYIHGSYYSDYVVTVGVLVELCILDFTNNFVKVKVSWNYILDFATSETEVFFNVEFNNVDYVMVKIPVEIVENFNYR